MENFKVNGKIISISEIEKLPAGSGKLKFRIDTGKAFDNILEFELWKKKEYYEHLEKFDKYNKLGDDVEVEFNIRAFNWKPESDNKIFTSLSCWKVNKLGVQDVVPSSEAEEVSSNDELPF